MKLVIVMDEATKSDVARREALLAGLRKKVRGVQSVDPDLVASGLVFIEVASQFDAEALDALDGVLHVRAMGMKFAEHDSDNGPRNFGPDDLTFGAPQTLEQLREEIDPKRSE